MAGGAQSERKRVILDTDANNELDDQHAIAYLLFNSHLFEVEGITTNRTFSGGGIEQHTAEAERVVRMCASEQEVPVFSGASATFEEIREHVGESEFDGQAAVNFIIERAQADDARKLVIILIGKFTNISLAVSKAPSIASKVRVIWLGSSWPAKGMEYNNYNDSLAVDWFINNTDIPLEVVTVRPGQPSGVAALTVSKTEINEKMTGKGPQTIPEVPGRSGGTFSNFGDYAIDLWSNVDETRPLFDLGAIAIVKEPTWADTTRWRSDAHERDILLYENFKRDAIIADFFATMENYVLPSGISQAYIQKKMVQRTPGLHIWNISSLPCGRNGVGIDGKFRKIWSHAPLPFLNR